jgi:hypothetical protein
MSRRSFFLLPVFFLSTLAYGQGDSLKKINILFVGNSLTYVNDIPSLIKELGKQDGKTITYTSFLFPDYSLEDHWNEGKVKAEIEKGRYDFVVVQQGPSALPESQVLLLDYTKRFAEICDKNKSKLALYMVWPSKARSFDLDNVISSYRKAAEKTSSLLCPAGLAWKYAWQLDSALSLYSEDNFHPSFIGSVLSAITIYGALTGIKDFNFILTNHMWKDEIGEARLQILLEGVKRAIYR